MRKNQLTCEKCPKYRRDISTCLHYAYAYPPFHPVCKYGRYFIKNEKARLGMAKLRARRKENKSNEG